MARKKIYSPPVGGIIKVKLEESYFTYARAISSAWVAFYDVKTDRDITDLKEIVSKPIKYTTAVDETPFDEGLWEVIGVLPLEERLRIVPPNARPSEVLQPDGTYKQRYTIFEPDGKMRYTENKDEVMGMERPIVWGAESIQQILIDIYSGRVSELREKYTIR